MAYRDLPTIWALKCSKQLITPEPITQPPAHKPGKGLQNQCMGFLFG